MAKRRHAEIAGGGFAGLVAAIALSRRGWTVRVHEKGEALRAFGAGIFIWENGLRVLKAIGAYDDVIAGSHEAKIYEVRDRGALIDQGAALRLSDIWDDLVEVLSEHTELPKSEMRADTLLLQQ